MDLESYKNQLRDIYLVSNTPSFLYETMKKSDIVKDYLSKFDKKDLFIEFSSRIKETITDTSDIAILYALMISLTFKKDKDVTGFFKYISDTIKFEWFSKIADYYLSNQTTSETFTFQVNPPSKIEEINQSNLKVTTS